MDVTPVTGQSAGEILSLFGHHEPAMRSAFDAALTASGADAETRELVLAALDRVLTTTPYLGEQD